MNADARLKRLFFALWPDAALRSSLEPRIRALQPDGVGRPQRPDQWHVTLEFLGSVAGPRIDAAVEAAACVGGAPFEISLDAVEHWRRPAVLCLVARTNPPALDEFVRRLRHELARQAFDCERRPFRAHLTLARKVVRPVAVPPFEPLCWPAREFALVESLTDRAGSHYVPLAQWPLAD